MQRLFLILTVLILQTISCQENKLLAEQSFISKNLEFKGIAVQDNNYTFWGCAPIQDEVGETHLFVARWPEKNVNPAWRKSSEIAHYVADSPEGSFRFSDVAIKGTGLET